jgi:DNA-directed RNA polymerase subunit RPC12/RpoP
MGGMTPSTRAEPPRAAGSAGIGVRRRPPMPGLSSGPARVHNGAMPARPIAITCRRCKRPYTWQGRPYGVARCPHCRAPVLIRRLLADIAPRRLRPAWFRFLR